MGSLLGPFYWVGVKCQHMDPWSLQGSTNLPAMYSVFACVGAIGVMTTLLLPETFMEPLAECLEDVEGRKRHPFFSWKVWSDPEPEPEVKATGC